MNVDIWIVFLIVAYVVIGFGAVNVINKAIPGRPRAATFLIYPLLLAMFAFSDLDKWS